VRSSGSANNLLDRLIQQAAKADDPLIRAWGRKLRAGGGRKSSKAKIGSDHAIRTDPAAGRDQVKGGHDESD
jgi:hypothetical protein